MATPAEELAEGIRLFCKQLHDGQIRKMYQRAKGDAQQRGFPKLAQGRPARDFSQLFVWALVNEHDRRQLA